MKHFHGHRSAAHRTLVDRFAGHKNVRMCHRLCTTLVQRCLSQADCTSDMESNDSDDSLSEPIWTYLFRSKRSWTFVKSSFCIYCRLYCCRNKASVKSVIYFKKALSRTGEKEQIGKSKENLKKKPKNSFKIYSPHISYKETPNEEVLKIALHNLSSETLKVRRIFHRHNWIYGRSIFCLVFKPKKGHLILGK